MKKIILTLATIVCLVAQANAAVIFSHNGVEPADMGPVPAATSTTGIVNENVLTSIPLQRRSPWDTTSLWVGTPGGAGTGPEFTEVREASEARYSISGNTLELMWGSPDAHNLIEFYLGGSLVDSIGGSAVLAEGYTPAQQFANVVIHSALFDEVRFSSALNSFEYANLKEYTRGPAIPEPTTYVIWGFMGLVATGLYRFRRK